MTWLASHKDVDVVEAGKHPAKVTAKKSGESYPLPIGHQFVNKHIVKDFMEWLEKNDVCTEQEFDDHI